MPSFLKRKVSVIPLLLIALSFAFELVYQYTCGACYFTGTITWWQIFLDDASPILFSIGTLGLILSFFASIYGIFREKFD